MCGELGTITSAFLSCLTMQGSDICMWLGDFIDGYLRSGVFGWDFKTKDWIRLTTICTSAGVDGCVICISTGVNGCSTSTGVEVVSSVVSCQIASCCCIPSCVL